jgi:hypothetical protein
MNVCMCKVKVKVKQSRNRPGVTQKFPGGLGSQISWHSAHEGGEVVSLTHRSPLPPGMFLVLIFTKGWVDPRVMLRSEGDMSLKNPVIPPEIDPGTVWLVAQRLNHYVTPGPMSVCAFIISTYVWSMSWESHPWSRYVIDDRSYYEPGSLSVFIFLFFQFVPLSGPYRYILFSKHSILYTVSLMAWDQV